jgi:hypothetical protein
LFFWRLFTPIESDQTSLVNGDFSGQFVAFAGYQYQRFAAGEIPLWNPYNNGGLPFIADTQAAVFYPPRLVTIALSKLVGGWSYHALELEMTAHVLAYSLFMYLLVRRFTFGQRGSEFGAFVASVIASYGGFMSSYPPLQLAILEAAIWLPLAVLGIFEATGDHMRPLWLVLTGFALGLSWMAGHPQTSFLLTYLLVFYFGYRVYIQKYRWMIFLWGTALFGLIAFGVVAVQLLPGVEYLAHTTRTGLGFDAKGNGLLFQDISQFIFPGTLGPWSPLYVGLVGLVLALIAVWRGLPQSRFWAIVAVVALVLSVGANSALFHALYNLIPGMRYFRGQERAVFLVANSLAILAGLGATHLVRWDKLQDFKATRTIQRGLIGLTFLCAMFTGVVFVRFIDSPDVYSQRVSGMTFSLIVAGVAALLFPTFLSNPSRKLYQGLVAGLVVFELFTVNIDNSNYEPIPPQMQLSMTPPLLVERVLNDRETPFRVDGYRGLHDNYGSLYGVMDMRGISPLFLDSAYAIIGQEQINPLAWELFAVRYVYSDWDELSVPSEIVTSGEDRYGEVNLHRLTNPRPFALLLYNATVVDSDEFAHALLHDSNFDPRTTVILNQQPDIPLSGDTPAISSANVTLFAPESFTVVVNSSSNAILSVSQIDYPGGYVTLDGESTEILRAYGALSAVAVPSGNHTVEFIYDPITYRVGAILSLITWSLLGLLAIVVVVRVIYPRQATPTLNID